MFKVYEESKFICEVGVYITSHKCFEDSFKIKIKGTLPVTASVPVKVYMNMDDKEKHNLCLIEIRKTVKGKYISKIKGIAFPNNKFNKSNLVEIFDSIAEYEQIDIINYLKLTGKI